MLQIIVSFSWRLRIGIELMLGLSLQTVSDLFLRLMLELALSLKQWLTQT